MAACNFCMFWQIAGEFAWICKISFGFFFIQFAYFSVKVKFRGELYIIYLVNKNDAFIQT